MQVQRIPNYSDQMQINNKKNSSRQQSFKAVLLKDNLVLKCGKQGEKTVNAALIELELEPRELIADRRFRHRDLIPKELKEKFKEKKDEIIKFLDKNIPKEDYYTGDYAFLGVLAAREPMRWRENPLRSTLANAMTRNQYPNMQYPAFVTIGEAWNKSYWVFNTNYTNNGHGLLRKELFNYMTNSSNSEKERGGYSIEKTPLWKLMKINAPMQYSSGVNADSLVYNDETNNLGTMRQRVIMLVEPNKDEKYRYLPPTTKVYGIAEFYTDRSADILSDIVKEHKKQDAKTIRSILDRFKIKGLNPTKITSFLAPLKIHRMYNGVPIFDVGSQANINSILDTENCDDAAKILFDNIKNRSRITKDIKLARNPDTITDHAIEFIHELRLNNK